MFILSEAEPTSGAARAEGTFVALRIAVGATVGVIWAGYMLALVALGSCDAFGGRCDGTSPPLFEDDVAGGAFVGTAARFGRCGGCVAHLYGRQLWVSPSQSPWLSLLLFLRVASLTVESPDGRTPAFRLLSGVRFGVFSKNPLLWLPGASARASNLAPARRPATHTVLNG